MIRVEARFPGANKALAELAPVRIAAETEEEIGLWAEIMRKRKALSRNDAEMIAIAAQRSLVCCTSDKPACGLAPAARQDGLVRLRSLPVARLFCARTCGAGCNGHGAVRRLLGRDIRSCGMGSRYIGLFPRRMGRGRSGTVAQPVYPRLDLALDRGFYTR